MEQTLQQVDARSQEMLMTARAILACSLNPSMPLTVPEIAMATGLTREAVRYALQSPAYQTLIENEIRTMVAGSMMRGVRKLDEIVNKDKVTDANAIAAVRAIAHVAQVISQVRDSDSADTDADHKLKAALRLIKEIGQAKDAT